MSHQLNTMSIRDDAIADILTATSPEVLGRDVMIEGLVISAVVKSLTAEEAAALGFNGISGQVTRMTMSAAALGFVPVHGQDLDVDAVTWNVIAVVQNGDLLRVTLARYTS